MVIPPLVGNALCLDLVNTVNDWFAPSRDLLADVDGARAWAIEALGGPVTPLTSADLDLLRSIRRDTRRVLASPDGETALEPPGACKDAQALDRQPQLVDDDCGPAAQRLLDQARRNSERARIRRGDGSFDLVWPSPSSGGDVAGRCALSAVGLMLRGPLGRVGVCPSCGWLFLDTSRNGRRIWCSMATCGSRDKARRHYARRHLPEPGQ